MFNSKEVKWEKERNKAKWNYQAGVKLGQTNKKKKEGGRHYHISKVGKELYWRNVSEETSNQIKCKTNQTKMQQLKKINYKNGLFKFSSIIKTKWMAKYHHWQRPAIKYSQEK